MEGAGRRQLRAVTSFAKCCRGVRTSDRVLCANEWKGHFVEEEPLSQGAARRRRPRGDGAPAGRGRPPDPMSGGAAIGVRATGRPCPGTRLLYRAHASVAPSGRTGNVARGFPDAPAPSRGASPPRIACADPTRIPVTL